MSSQEQPDLFGDEIILAPSISQQDINDISDTSYDISEAHTDSSNVYQIQLTASDLNEEQLISPNLYQGQTICNLNNTTASFIVAQPSTSSFISRVVAPSCFTVIIFFMNLNYCSIKYYLVIVLC